MGGQGAGLSLDSLCVLVGASVVLSPIHFSLLFYNLSKQFSTMSIARLKAWYVFYLEPECLH